MKFPTAFACLVAAAAMRAAANDGKDIDDAQLMQEMKDSHPLWLRERCADGSKESSTTIPTDVKVTSVKADKSGGGFVARFGDGHECFFAQDFIAQELREDEASAATKAWGTPELFLWNKNLVSPVSYDRDTITDMSDNTRKFLSNLLSTGIAAIENVPTKDQECLRLGLMFSSLRETELGRVFNITQPSDETTPASSSVVDRNGKHAHYKGDAPPDFEMIHTLQGCEESNDCKSYHTFVDGYTVADALCAKDRASFDMLATTVLRWETPTGGSDGSVFYRYAPIFEVQENGEDAGTKSCPAVKAINFNSGGLAPKMSNSDLEQFYGAKQMFSEMIQSDEFIIKVPPSVGNVLVFDNRRVLHSFVRGASDRETLLQGCYLNRDGFAHLYEKLRRQFASMTETPFHSLKSAVKADFDRMGAEYDEAVVKKTKDKLIGLLEGLKDSYLGQPVSLYEHNVQTASRSFRAGEDDETVFLSLFHDVFETLAVKNHGEVIAAMLAPWISPKNHWMLAHHEVFQGYYYFEDYGIPKTKRDIYIDHPAYNQTVDWCEKYDQASFDPDYPSLPLSTFFPAIDRVLARPQYWWNPAHPKAGAVSSAAEFADFTLGKPMGDCPDTWQCYETS